jgi:hypothetical protein
MGGYIGSRASVVSSGVERKKTFDVSTTTTVFATGFTLSDYLTHVYHNGIRLVSGTDFTTSGTSVTLTTAAEDGDQVVVLMYSSARRDASNNNITGDLSVSGDVVFEGMLNNDDSIDAATTIASGRNAAVIGPVTVNAAVTINGTLTVI